MTLSINPVDQDLNRQLLKDHNGEKTGWYQVGPQKYLFPSKYAVEAENFLNVKTRKDDIWISTFPRSGTTLTQEMVWMIVNGCDFEKGKKHFLYERSLSFEFSLFFHPQLTEKLLRENEGNAGNRRIVEYMTAPGFDVVEDLESPRVIQTHFAPSLMPRDITRTKPKVIYVARHPKDVVVSLYYLLRLWRSSDYTNTFEQFCSQFIEGHVPWGPYWSHVLEGWSHRHDPNYLFLFYEETVKDLKGTITRVATFLDVKMTDEQIDSLTDHLDIRNFKNNPSVNYENVKGVGILNQQEESFIRQGKTRGSGQEFTPEMKERFDKWIEDNYRTTDFRLPARK